MTDTKPTTRAPHKQDSARQDAPAPCDACLFSSECTAPNVCTPFRYYIETGKAIRPPRELPG